MAISHILLFFLFLNLVSSDNIPGMEFQASDSTIAYYMDSKLFQELKKKIIISGYDYKYGFFLGKLEKITKTEDNGDLGIKVIKKNGQSVTKQARCTTSYYTEEGLHYVLFCNVNEEFASLTITPQAEDTIVIQGYDKIKFTTDDNIDDSSSILKSKYIVLIVALLLFI